MNTNSSTQEAEHMIIEFKVLGKHNDSLIVSEYNAILASIRHCELIICECAELQKSIGKDLIFESTIEWYKSIKQVLEGKI